MAYLTGLSARLDLNRQDKLGLNLQSELASLRFDR
jgi:hypothetical protein